MVNFVGIECLHITNLGELAFLPSGSSLGDLKFAIFSVFMIIFDMGHMG